MDTKLAYLHYKEDLKLLVCTEDHVEEVNSAVQKELDVSGANLGYRRIWASLKR